MTEIAGRLEGVSDAELDLLEFVERSGSGQARVHFSVPDAYCAACIDVIERGVKALPGVTNARVNLTRRTVQVDFAGDDVLGSIPAAIRSSGYSNHPIDPRDVDGKDPVLGELVRSLVVAGFATIHVMFFSEAVWSGVDPTTRQLFYWISAIIALPATVYAGASFFRSAWAALRVGRANMDVPIAIGLIATSALSLFETIVNGPHAYYDASTMLLLFLLAGRTLEHLVRSEARSAVTTLARLAPRGGYAIGANDQLTYIALDAMAPGMQLLLRAGDRVPVDCTLLSDSAEVDLSLVTGESLPITVQKGADLPAGAANLSSAVRVKVKHAAADSFLARTAALMEAAESTRTKYRRVADRAADFYAPAVHLAAAVTFVGWLLLQGSWHQALLNAVAVLIVTCPCALALAVPIVHVIAAERLLRHGILMRDGAALERLADLKLIAFDKTGTLTFGQPTLVSTTANDEQLSIAAQLASASNHPLSRAIVSAVPEPLAPVQAREFGGAGIEATVDGHQYRLGSATFCGVTDPPQNERSHVWLARDRQPVATFSFDDHVRDEAVDAIAALKAAGLRTHILSGDTIGPVELIGRAVQADQWEASLTPEQKLRRIEELRSQYGPTAMVGDGINDAAALRAADVSFAPAQAADVGRAAADFILTKNRIDGVPYAYQVARFAKHLVRQNLWFSILYNAAVLPLAISGMVTPLIAAIAMSSSSIIVVLNSMRLRWVTMSATSTQGGRQ
jgi:Cu2+-exporting ATPase